jgi:hypothetical protein
MAPRPCDAGALRDLYVVACGFTPMMCRCAGRTVVGTMNTTATQVTPGLREPRTRAVDRLRRQAHLVLRDAATTPEREAAPRRDDRSHTAPHGDPLLPLRRP